MSDSGSKAEGAQVIVEIRASTSGKLKPLSLDVADLKQHPLAEQFHFPPMIDEQLKAFNNDIKEHGAHESVAIYEEKILDGMTRYEALKASGRPFTGSEFCLYDEFYSGDPVSYVISRNVLRRHLSDDQRGAWAAVAWQQQKQKPGPKVDQKIIFSGKPEKIAIATTVAQQKQESRERKAQLAADYMITVNALEEQTSLLKADSQKAGEVKAGKMTFREAKEAVAEKTGKRRPRKPKLKVLEFKDGHMLKQVFHEMFSRGLKTAEIRVVGQARAIITLDADVKPVIGVTASEIVEIAAAQNPPISESDALAMLDRCKAKGLTYEDWGGALRTWRREGWLWSQKPPRAPMSQRRPEGPSTVMTPAQADRAAAAQAEKMKASLERQQKLDSQEGAWNRH